MKLPTVILVALICLLSVKVYAGDIIAMQIPIDKVRVKTICLDGFVFVVAATGGKSQAGRGVSIAQVYRKFNNFGNPPIPLTCDR